MENILLNWHAIVYVLGVMSVIGLLSFYCVELMYKFRDIRSRAIIISLTTALALVCCVVITAAYMTYLGTF